MMGFSVWHLLLVLAVVLVLFGGKGKISGIMGDFGRGINAFKKGLKTEKAEEVDKNDDDATPNQTIGRG
jgi:sec-independent protein translocase protein TatA